MRQPTFDLQVSSEFRRTERRDEDWRQVRPYHKSLLDAIDRAIRDGRSTFTMREARAAAHVGGRKDTTERVMNMLRDLEEHMGQITLEPVDEHHWRIMRLKTPALTTMAFDPAAYRETGYSTFEVEGPTRDYLAGWWNILYGLKRRQTYPFDRRGRAALLRLLRQGFRPEQIMEVMKAYLWGEVAFEGYAEGIDVTVYKQHRQWPYRLLTFAAIYPQLVEKVVHRMQEIATELGKTDFLPSWAVLDVDESEAVARRHLIRFVHARGGQTRVTPEERLQAEWAIRNRYGLTQRDRDLDQEALAAREEARLALPPPSEEYKAEVKRRAAGRRRAAIDAEYEVVDDPPRPSPLYPLRQQIVGKAAAARERIAPAQQRLQRALAKIADAEAFVDDGSRDAHPTRRRIVRPSPR